MEKFEIEITRHNVTPAQFLAYVRSRVDAKGGKYLRSDLVLDYFKAGNDLNFDLHHDGVHERSISKPYEMQSFIRYEDGMMYNEICEFNFWDDKTGTGYYYLVNIDTTEEASEEEPTADDTAEEVTEEEAEEETTEEEAEEETTEEEASESEKVLYLDQWTHISDTDRAEIKKYIENTDVIITLSDDGVYRISAPQDDDRFTDYDDFIEFVRFNLDCFQQIGIL